MPPGGESGLRGEVSTFLAERGVAAEPRVILT